MYDWRKMTENTNPCDFQPRLNLQKYLNSIYLGFIDDILKFIVDISKTKKVLDIGIVQHSIDRAEVYGWKHKIISDVSQYCLGIDILEKDINELKIRGFNVKCVDATSDVFLNEKFDVIFIGDVIEHVNDPLKLINFAERHLETGGKIYIITPNANFLSLHTISQLRRSREVIPNLEHTCLIIPAHMNEICCRTNTKFVGYYWYTEKSRGKLPLKLLKRCLYNIINVVIKKVLPEVSQVESYIYVIQK